MAIRRTNRRRSAAPPEPAKRRPKPKSERPRVNELRLPDKLHQPSHDITDYTLLLYSPPKVAKTTFFCSFPDPLWLMTEPGKPGYPVFIFNEENGGVTSWEIMREAVHLIEASDRFGSVVIDTLDEAYRMCQDFVCRSAGVEHPHDANDYGKTWDKVTNEFTQVFRQLRQTNRGLYLTSHAKESVVKTASGKEFSKVGPSLTGKAGAKVLALVDFIFYVDYYNVGGEDVRVVVTRGSEIVTAGQRKISGLPNGMPTFIRLPEDETKDYEVFAAAFRGEVEGVDPRELTPTMLTTKAGSKMAEEARVEELKKGGRAGG